MTPLIFCIACRDSVSLFPNLSGPLMLLTTHLTMRWIAVDAALNIYRDGGGNMQCGPVAAVLSTRFVGTNAIAFPVDTGNFGQGGNDCLKLPPTIPVNWSSCFQCKDCAEHPPLGQPGSLLHLLRPFFSFRHHTMPLDKQPSVEEVAARLMVRLLSRSTFRHAVQPEVFSNAPLALSWVENTVSEH